MELGSRRGFGWRLGEVGVVGLGQKRMVSRSRNGSERSGLVDEDRAGKIRADRGSREGRQEVGTVGKGRNGIVAQVRSGWGRSG